MNSKVVIFGLRKMLDDLISQKKEAIEKFDSEIQEVKDAITELGYSSDQEDLEIQTLYDDENPDYVRGSLEEI